MTDYFDDFILPKVKSRTEDVENNRVEILYEDGNGYSGPHHCDGCGKLWDEVGLSSTARLISSWDWQHSVCACSDACAAIAMKKLERIANKPPPPRGIVYWKPIE